MAGITIYNGCGCGCGCGGNSGGSSSGGNLDSGVGDSGVTFPDLPASSVECFADKSVAYLLDRARDFQLQGLDVARFGWDAVGLAFDEGIDLALLIAGILTGRVDLNSLGEIGEANIKSAFADQSFRSKMTQAWVDLGYTGEVSREQLREWVDNAPVLLGLVAPMRSWLDQWLTYSIIPNYNRALAQFARECSVGQSLPGPNPTIPVIEETSGYRFYVWSNALFSQSGQEFPLTLAAGDSASRVVAARALRAPVIEDDVLEGAPVGIGGAFVGTLGYGPNSNASNVGGPNPLIFQAGEAIPLGLMEAYVPTPGTDIFNMSLEENMPDTRNIALSLGSDNPRGGFKLLFETIVVATLLLEVTPSG